MTGHLYLIVAPAAEDSHFELQARPAGHQRHGSDQILAGIETTDHTYLLGICELPGTADEKMVRLREWRSERVGIWQALAAYVLCKKPFIAVGRLGVSSFW